MPNQREVMQRTRKSYGDGGQDEFLDRSLPVVDDREYRALAARRPAGNGHEEHGESARAHEKLERVLGS